MSLQNNKTNKKQKIVYKKNKSYRPYKNKTKYYENSYKNNYKKYYYNAKSRQKRKALMPIRGKRKAKKLDINCHKCGKVGHYANQCWTKKALNKIEDEQLRAQLKMVMLRNYDSEKESSNEEDLGLIYETSSESSSFDNDDCQCNETNY